MNTQRISGDTRALLLNVLWHHQGGSSKIGQPIRAMLGIGEHARLTDDQVREALWIDGLLAARSDDAAPAPASWSKEPPTKKGWYWQRNPLYGIAPRPLKVQRSPEGVMLVLDGGEYGSAWFIGGEWILTPLQEPTTTGFHGSDA